MFIFAMQKDFVGTCIFSVPISKFFVSFIIFTCNLDFFICKSFF